jgi:hypothetical protein
MTEEDRFLIAKIEPEAAELVRGCAKWQAGNLEFYLEDQNASSVPIAPLGGNLRSDPLGLPLNFKVTPPNHNGNVLKTVSSALARYLH